MSALTPVTDSVVTLITGSILPAVLTILGSFLTLIVGVFGALMVLAHFKGQSMGDVLYKVGHLFGSEIHDNEYRAYKSKLERRDKERAWDIRYIRERSRK